ncbi:beta-lactamase family protein [Nonomuraea glycinis]|uniref:Carboxylesterase n=1 Tax=Nonomuraea glycinis TaxID=2047744 RepID=A0A918A9F9_9ACTN|nr:serine hydrolase domain-containing protein [Nonomuraea glycinis]MCA2182281.1 beta-lactamase family protein [Nonomuraea glycinis]GGP11222.1 carboxylesterase [Nonomuraea glycinis]
MHCDPRFSRVREVFARQFAEGLELGAAFAVYQNGELVVDLWDGVADGRTGRRWEHDTPVFAYSCTKAVTATVLLQLAERGLVDVSAPVADLWPEFAAEGKASITVEHLLTHQAGLPLLEEPVPVALFEDQPAIAARLAGQAPIWEPGSAHGYHALTYGFLVGEVVRRVTGKSVGDLVAAEIAGPLGLDLWVGAPDDVIERAARIKGPGRRSDPVTAVPEQAARDAAGDAAGGAAGGTVFTRMAAAARDPQSLMNRALGNPDMRLLDGGANNPVILRAGWPAAGVVTSAAGLAGFYRALIAGELLRPETLSDAIRPRVTGPDRILSVDSSFGLGYMRPAMTFLAPSPSAFGHSGAGGFLGLGDAEHGLAAGYVMNQMADALSGSMRAYHLIQAVYESL